MPDTEKVINKVTAIVADMQEEVDEWKDYSDSELRCGLTCDCDWWYKTLQTLKDALALLKAQEPRAMADTELEAIRKAPLILKPNVDAVPVVRCRDCTYYDSEPGGDIMMCYNGLGWTEQNDFCSKGERRDGE